MSDEQERRREPQPDETGRFDPFADDDDATRVGGIHPEGGPRSGDPSSPAGSSGFSGDDATRQFDPASGSSGEPTRQVPRDGTQIMPGAGQDWADQGWNAREPVWSGRAEVRAPRPSGYQTTTDWDNVPPPPEPGGKWWMPILLGVIGLVLLGALGWGLYLIAQNSDDSPAPTPSAPAEPTTRPTTPATTEPTTTNPTTEPTTTEPTDTSVTVPALVGLSQQEAQQALDRRGLTYRLIFRTSDAADGTVIDSDPAEGQEVPPDTQVALVIARSPTTEPTAEPS